MEVATRAGFTFDQQPATFSPAAVANAVYTTPAAVRPKLGDLSRLSYLRGRLTGTIVLNAADTVTFTVHLSNGVYDDTVSVTISAGTRGHFEFDGIDMAQITGNSGLYLEVDITATGAVATTATITGQLEVESPLIINTCT